MLIIQAIPCIMHLENHVGEKLITVLLAIGANRFQEQHAVVTLNAYASSIQDIVNTSMIGTITRPKQWKVPTNESGDAVVKVSFSNKKTRKFVDNLDNLIDFIFSAPEDTEMNRTWKTMIKKLQGCYDNITTAK
jgi:hypothetical protein